MVCILFSVSTAEGGPDARLEDFIIHPGYRRQGIGERLLDEVFRRAREAGCARLTLLTDHTNESAIRFYRRAGFLPSRMIPFRISL
jgi:ribosomal protein S18 acetylase RimI-like enzyme